MFAELWSDTIFSQTIQQGNNQNTDFADSVLNAQNVYLSFGVFESCSDICYSVLVTNNCHQVYNSAQITNNSEHVYHCVAVDASSFIFYSKYIQNSHHVYFSTNMVGCHDCMLCDGLENASYCIENKQYTKDEYEVLKEKVMSKKDNFHYYPDSTKKSKNFNSDNVT